LGGNRSPRFTREFSKKRLLRRFHFSFTANPNCNLAVRGQSAAGDGL
jgi:hypothetical protein